MRSRSLIPLVKKMHRYKKIKYLHDIVDRNSATKKLFLPLYYAFQDLKYSHIVRRNRTLKGIFNGKRCFMLFPGASLNELDLTLLANEHTVATSFLYKHKDFRKLNVTAYAVSEPVRNCYNARTAFEVHQKVDSCFVNNDNIDQVIHDRYAKINRSRVDRDIIEGAPTSYFRAIDSECINPDTIFLLNAINQRFIHSYDIFGGRRVHYAKVRGIINAGNRSCDLAKSVTAPSSFSFSIAAAAYMGFKELYLCGAGYTYKPRYEHHFYDSPIFSVDYPSNSLYKAANAIATAWESSILEIRKEDTCYRPIFVRDCDSVIQCHIIAKEFAKKNGIKIYNVVPDGFQSPIFEKVSWKDVVNNVLTKE